MGLTASSHKVIGNLLDAVMAAAREAGVPVRALQKADEAQRCSDRDVQCVGSNGQVVDALDVGDVDLVAGTSWLLTREELAGRLDVLVVDEAGQLSLANTLAVSRAARNLLLLGDPQQLRQPGRGIHPDGADVSALEHVLGADEVLPADRGVFLDRSWRMAPALCSVVSGLAYDGSCSRPGSPPTTSWTRHRAGRPRPASAGCPWSTRATAPRRWRRPPSSLSWSVT
ncbi:hypothetical protein A7K94_0216620 [Modestobacter sp. VKM Ac-2676]|nr:hypothetical protein A7K94_0216620 [Modestobacter sp. VKM Ac-2676]